ncbi:MAG: SDR family oxidoreductase [Candidatus Eiseniibacteriota bacterium]|nr:MAG: SDR family oxidoreductase [Candidatus Eisenbacteria bacterium]
MTGGGAGIGKALCLALGRAGAAVMVNYRSERAPAARVVDDIRASGGEAAVVAADVSLPRGARKAVETTVRTFGQLDVLINNVGEFLHKPLLEVEPEEWRRTVQSNLDSSFYCSSYAGAQMRKQEWGRIINLGVAGCENVRAFPNTTAYNAAKTGVLILTKSMAKELAPFGVTVNVVAPGMVDTEALSEREMRRVERGLPMRRAATLEEISAIVLFLVSEDASYVTGSCIPVSGGWLL